MNKEKHCHLMFGEICQIVEDFIYLFYFIFLYYFFLASDSFVICDSNLC